MEISSFTFNCEIELDLLWSRICIIFEIAIKTAVDGDPDTNLPVLTRRAILTTGATFQGAMSWNKYRSEMTTQPKSNKLNFMIDATFRNISRLINRLFVLSFKNSDEDSTIIHFDKNYIPRVEIKDFNALIGNKPFLDQPVKSKQKVYKKG